LEKSQLKSPVKDLEDIISAMNYVGDLNALPPLAESLKKTVIEREKIIT